MVCQKDPTGLRKGESIFHVGSIVVAVHLKPFPLQDWELRGDHGGHNQETALCKRFLTIAAVRNDATKFGAISTPTSLLQFVHLVSHAPHGSSLSLVTCHPCSCAFLLDFDFLLFCFDLSFPVFFFSFHLLHFEQHTELDNLIAMQNLRTSANKG